MTDLNEEMLAQLEDSSDLASLEAAIKEPERDYEIFLTEMGLSTETG